MCTILESYEKTNPNEMTFLSIITVHKNNLSGLLITLNSIQKLISSGEVEWIVIDGASELRNAKELQSLKQISDSADQFISESDKGIYDAMNKGAGLATGTYVLYMNAGDELHTEFDLAILKSMSNITRPDMIWGLCQEKYESGALVQIKTRSRNWAWWGTPVCHQSTFYARNSLGQAPFDTNFKIAGDYDLLCRLLKNDSKVEFLDSLVSVFHRGGVSGTQTELTFNEENIVRLKYFPIPRLCGNAIKNIRLFNFKLAKWPWFRRVTRKWI